MSNRGYSAVKSAAARHTETAQMYRRFAAEPNDRPWNHPFTRERYADMAASHERCAAILSTMETK